MGGLFSSCKAPEIPASPELPQTVKNDPAPGTVPAPPSPLMEEVPLSPPTLAAEPGVSLRQAPAAATDVVEEKMRDDEEGDDGNAVQKAAPAPAPAPAAAPAVAAMAADAAVPPQTPTVALLVQRPEEWTAVHIHFSADNTSWTNAPGPRIEGNAAEGKPGTIEPSKFNAADGWHAITIPGKRVTFCINDGAAQWDNNGGANYVVENPGVYTLKSGIVAQIPASPHTIATSLPSAR
mmetsp:Transcript_19438/g.50548  ORF Transcript_19438/g.50548 Transcript_19438/m.50548 type:complete len:236 (+) Transcript_19438:38-745(+)